MTTKTTTTTTALILAAFALVGGAIITIGVLPTSAYAQLSEVSDLVDETLESVAITEEEEVEDTNIDQPIDQEAGQEVVNQSEENDQDDDNTQIQTGVDDQDTAQGIVDGNDLAESSSVSGDANKKYSSSSSSFSDTEYSNEQGAGNDGVLNQGQDEDVDQDHAAIFADDNADLDDANVGVPIAVPINLQEQAEEEVEEPEPPVEEDTITVCIIGEGEEEVNLEELQELVDEGTAFFIGTCDLLP